MPDSTQIDFSVFTCTYNRADLLQRLYRSLCNQGHRHFEWVVFDNGSTDNTQEVLNSLKNEADFPITILHWPENTGYQNTFNAGLGSCKGKFWLNIDSDDEIKPNAMERFLEIWNSIPEQDRDGYSGVTVCSENQHGKLVGNTFPVDPLDSNTLETLYRYKSRGEKCGIIRLDVLRQFEFTQSAEHVNNRIVWKNIGRRYKTRYTNDRLMIYYVDETGRLDQISSQLGAGSHNDYGRWFNHRDTLNTDMDFFRYAPIQFYKTAVVYCMCGTHLKHGPGKLLSDVKPWPAKVLTLLAYPPGRILAAIASR